MANTMTSLDMNLPIPVVGVDPGPDWALNINSCLTIIDSHDHSSGKGVQITPNGLNINSTLTVNGNDVINFRSVRFAIQASVAGASDLGCLYVSGQDLYFNDETGAPIQITKNGGVNGSPGSISNLNSPASASYISGNATFVWQSAVNIAANLDAGSIILRNLTLNSKGLTLSPPNAMGSDYSIILPFLPVTQSIMTIDASGNIATPAVYPITSAGIANATITGSNIANATITSANLASDVGTVPTGVISAFGGTSAPNGYLMCDGTSYLRSSYLTLFGVIGTAFGAIDSTHFNVPDLRGRFLRGVDNTANRDPDKASRTAMNTGGNTGNNVGSVQTDQYKSHTHTAGVLSTTNYGQTNAVTYFAGVLSGNTGASGGNETRPINAYVNYIIKI